MVASGATVLLLHDGAGTPLGFPAPTIKVASNSEIARKKPHWIDFDAGRAARRSDRDGRARGRAVRASCSTSRAARHLTNNERNGVREIAIWKEGVTL